MSEDDLMDDQKDFLALNEKYSAKWPVITSMKAAPDDAKYWENVENKHQYIEE